METLLLNYTTCYEALNPYVVKRRTVSGIQILILRPESEILASQWKEAHYHCSVSCCFDHPRPIFFISQGFLGSLSFDFDIFVPYLKMPAWITETVVSFQFQAGHNWLLNLKVTKKSWKESYQAIFANLVLWGLTQLNWFLLGNNKFCLRKETKWRGPKVLRFKNLMSLQAFKWRSILPRLPLWLQKCRLPYWGFPFSIKNGRKERDRRKEITRLSWSQQLSSIIQLIHCSCFSVHFWI